MATLIEELIISVLQYGTTQEIINNGLVSNMWYKCSCSNTVWRPRVLCLFSNADGEPKNLPHDFYKWAYALLRSHLWVFDPLGSGNMIHVHGGKTAYTGVTGKNESIRTKFKYFCVNDTKSLAPLFHYWEIKINEKNPRFNLGIGIATSRFELDGNFVGYLAMGGTRTDVMSIGYSSDSVVRCNALELTHGITTQHFEKSDSVGCLWDITNSKITFFRNGTHVITIDDLADEVKKRRQQIFNENITPCMTLYNEQNSISIKRNELTVPFFEYIYPRVMEFINASETRKIKRHRSFSIQKKKYCLIM